MSVHAMMIALRVCEDHYEVGLVNPELDGPIVMLIPKSMFNMDTKKLSEEASLMLEVFLQASEEGKLSNTEVLRDDCDNNCESCDSVKRGTCELFGPRSQESQDANIEDEPTPTEEA